MAEVSKYARIKVLRGAAASLRNACQTWASKYGDRRYYDKQGFGFVRDSRMAAFNVQALSFEAYVGTYGSSSVGTAWHVDQDTINRFFLKALNENKQAIFDSIAKAAEQEAASLVADARKELADMQAMLDAADAPLAEAEAA